MFDWTWSQNRASGGRLSSWTFGNAYRANVGHRALLDGLVACNLLIPLALPRGLEEFFRREHARLRSASCPRWL
jgi:hypothetical protein